jgi:hypothetical protein
MGLKFKMSVLGEKLTECPDCGAWKPERYERCYDCKCKHVDNINKIYGSQVKPQANLDSCLAEQ